MDNITCTDTVFVFFIESQQISCSVTAAGFYFNRVYLIFGFDVIGYNKIDFNIVSAFSAL